MTFDDMNLSISRFVGRKYYSRSHGSSESPKLRPLYDMSIRVFKTY